MQMWLLRCWALLSRGLEFGDRNGANVVVVVVAACCCCG